MNREEVIALAQKFDMRKGRRPRVSAPPRPTVTVMGSAAASSAVGRPNGNNNTPMPTGAPQNMNVLSTRSEVEAAARLYDERLARASAYARKRRRDGKSTIKHSSSSPPARSLAPRSSTQRAKRPHKANKPAPIVTSFPSTKVQPQQRNSVNAPMPSAQPEAGNSGYSRNAHTTVSAAVSPPQAGNTRIVSAIPSVTPVPAPAPSPEAYSSPNIVENASVATFTPKSEDINTGNENNPHHVITSASAAPLSASNHDHSTQPTAPLNIVSTYNTHQNEVIDLPAYPTFPEEPSASFDAPIYGPHPQSDQYTSNQQQSQQPADTIHYSQSHQEAQQQDAIEFIQPLHPTAEEQVGSLNQEQQRADQIVAFEQQVIDSPHPQPNAVSTYGNEEIAPQSSSDAFVQSTVEFTQEVGVEQNGVHGHVNSFVQNGTFGDAQTGVEGTNPGFTDVTNGGSTVEAFQDASFGEGTNVNVVFEGPANVYEGANNGANGGTYGDVAGDPVAVEQTAQVEGYAQNEPSAAPNNNSYGNGLVQEAPTGDTTCYETAAGPQLFHEYPPGGFDGDGEYAHLIPPPPEPEEGDEMEWDTGTGTHTTSSTGFEEDALGELDVPAKKRRFAGMHIFGQEKRSKIFEHNE